MLYSPLLAIHVTAGILGVLSGAAALSFRKGGPRHALAGKIFVAAMLVLATSAVYLAIAKYQTGNVLGGTFTFYLIATAWATVWRREGQTDIFDWGAMLIPSVVGIGLVTLGLQVVYGHATPAKRSSCANVFLHGYGDVALCRWRSPHVAPWRSLRQPAHRPSSLADVLRPVHRHRFFLSRPAAGLPRLAAWFAYALSSSAAATSSDDFLDPAGLVFVGLAQASRRKACRPTVIPTGS
jgi:uncharacterized membrane protein